MTSSKSTTLSAGSTIWTTQKSTIPNQAGNWYYVTVGALQGYWIPEAAGMTLGAPPPPLPAPIAIYNPPRQLLIAPGTYVGRRFSQYGISAGTWTATVTTASSAPTSRYSTLPGQSGKWYYIIDGEFESYWLLEQPGITGPGARTTDLVFDSTGYFVPGSSGASFVPLTPARLLDSRFGNGLSGPFSAGTPRTFQVTGRGGVPANATAVTGNLTVTGQSTAGYVFLGPDPTPNPASSTLNFPLGDSRANGVTVALGAGGSLSATYLAPAGATTHLIFDVTGYFVPGSSGASFVPLTPARLLDSRFGNGLSRHLRRRHPAHLPGHRPGRRAVGCGGGHRQPDGHQPDRGGVSVPGSRPGRQPDQLDPQLPARRHPRQRGDGGPRQRRHAERHLRRARRQEHAPGLRRDRLLRARQLAAPASCR